MKIFRTFGGDTHFDDHVRWALQGDFKDKCLDKIAEMGGIIVAADMDNGQFTDTIGETLYFVCSANPTMFATLRTDDSYASFTAMGDRFVDGRDRIMEMLFKDVEPPFALKAA